MEQRQYRYEFTLLFFRCTHLLSVCSFTQQFKKQAENDLKAKCSQSDIAQNGFIVKDLWVTSFSFNVSEHF